MTDGECHVKVGLLLKVCWFVNSYLRMFAYTFQSYHFPVLQLLLSQLFPFIPSTQDSLPLGPGRVGDYCTTGGL